MKTIRELYPDGDANEWSRHAWEGWVGDQGIAEFLEVSRQLGHITPEEAVRAYVADLAERQEVPPDLSDWLLACIHREMRSKNLGVSADWLSGLQWHTPPRNRGQIVEVAYAVGDDGRWYRRLTDHSWPEGHPDRVLHQACIAPANVPFEPWNWLEEPAEIINAWEDLFVS